MTLLQIALYGKNFCTSAKNAFSLILRNVVRVAVVDKVTDFVLFLSRLVIIGLVGTSFVPLSICLLVRGLNAKSRLNREQNSIRIFLL